MPVTLAQLFTYTFWEPGLWVRLCAVAEGVGAAWPWCSAHTWGLLWGPAWGPAGFSSRKGLCDPTTQLSVGHLQRDGQEVASAPSLTPRLFLSPLPWEPSCSSWGWAGSPPLRHCVQGLTASVDTLPWICVCLGGVTIT